MSERDGGSREQLIHELSEVHRLVSLGARASVGQLADTSVRTYPETATTVTEMQRGCEEHAAILARRLDALGHPADREVGGLGGPPVDSEGASEALRWDQAFLQRLALAYQRLRSAAQADRDDETVGLADRGYGEIQHVIRERVSRAQPRAAAADNAVPSSGARGTVPQGPREA